VVVVVVVVIVVVVLFCSVLSHIILFCYPYFYPYFYPYLPYLLPLRRVTVGTTGTVGTNNVQGSGLIEQYTSMIDADSQRGVPTAGLGHSHCYASSTDLLRTKYGYPHIYENK
jgi:hypothetical protein